MIAKRIICMIGNYDESKKQQSYKYEVFKKKKIQRFLIYTVCRAYDPSFLFFS